MYVYSEEDAIFITITDLEDYFTAELTIFSDRNTHTRVDSGFPKVLLKAFEP